MDAHAHAGAFHALHRHGCALVNVGTCGDVEDARLSCVSRNGWMGGYTCDTLFGGCMRRDARIWDGTWCDVGRGAVKRHPRKTNSQCPNSGLWVRMDYSCKRMRYATVTECSIGFQPCFPSVEASECMHLLYSKNGKRCTRTKS